MLALRVVVVFALLGGLNSRRGLDPKVSVFHFFFHSSLFPLFSLFLPLSFSLGSMACVHGSATVVAA